MSGDCRLCGGHVPKRGESYADIAYLPIEATTHCDDCYAHLKRTGQVSKP